LPMDTSEPLPPAPPPVIPVVDDVTVSRAWVASPRVTATTMLREGMTGDRVRHLEIVLATVPVDGVFGADDKARLAELQRLGGITADGVFGPQTAAKFVEWRGW
jgi:peptidoglycan hydrolase-like protein with peptidoglycan-binding domain